MSKVNNKTRAIRSAERDVQIDFESDAAAKLLGIEDPEALREVIEDIGKGRRTWGLQAAMDDSISLNNLPPGPHSTKTELGEIDGWPLDPSFYGEDGWSGTKNANSGAEQAKGIVNGIDIRGMVPGTILRVKIERAPESLPPELNIP